MTDQPFTPEQEPVAMAEPEPEAGPGPSTEAAEEPVEAQSPQGREWLAQLQHMIDRIATDAAPVAREVAAKAAELAAVAGEKAGPFAKRAAEVTGDVGVRVAERSRRLADDLRSRAGGENGSGSGGDGESAG